MASLVSNHTWNSEVELYNIRHIYLYFLQRVHWRFWLSGRESELDRVHKLRRGNFSNIHFHEEPDPPERLAKVKHRKRQASSDAFDSVNRRKEQPKDLR